MDCERRESAVGSASQDSTQLGKIAAWLGRHEGAVFGVALAVCAFLIFAVNGEMVLNCDNPGYTDPAINYLTGKGFTSSCWYAQRWDAFWAGNVPLHQFLLIPWLKIFGIGLHPVLWLNSVYVAAGMTLLWRGMQKSGLLPDVAWRLGAMVFILFTNCSYFLLTAARYDALSFLLVSLAAWLLTVRSPVCRLGGLFALAFLLPWSHLAMSVYTGVMGGLLLLFYRKSLWREVFFFGAGGGLGAAALFALYRHLGVWEGFLMSVAPHMMGGRVNTQGQAWRYGGVTSLYYPFTAAILCFLVLYLVRKRSWRFPLFALVCAFLVPAVLIKTGIFSAYYGWCLLFLLVAFVFALLSREPVLQRHRWRYAAILVMLGMAFPGGLLRRAIDNRRLLNREGNPNERIAEFAQSILEPADVAWVDEAFYYQAKPRVASVVSSPVAFADFGGAVSYPGRQEELDSVSVCIFRETNNLFDASQDRMSRNPPPGVWAPTGQKLSAWGTTYSVYRRTDRPQP